MQDGAVAGFKYFEFESLLGISLMVGGDAKGYMVVADDENFQNEIVRIDISSEYGKVKSFKADAKDISGKHALYFKFEGNGKLDFMSFELIGGGDN